MDGLEAFESPDKGRGLRVSRASGPGRLLYSCPPYACVLSAQQRGDLCDFCFSRKEGLARCGKCKKAHYCNLDCQKGDWPAHKLECSAMVAFGERWAPSESARLAARILAKKKTQQGRSGSEKLLAVHDMQSHAEDMDAEARDKSRADAAGLHRFYSKHLDIPDSKELLSLFSRVSCNGFAIEDEELSRLGTAVYPDLALINHSCLPNAVVTFHGTRAHVRALHPMEPGEEVLISYIDLLYPTDERRRMLEEAYYFSCRCHECQSGSKDGPKLKARRGGAPAEAALSRARKTIRDFRELKLLKSPAELLETCRRSLEEMGRALGPANVYVLHMRYQAMGVCIYLGELRAALRYGETLLQPFRQLYPPYSLNVASLYLKLSRLYLALDRRSAGADALQEAAGIMEVTHGEEHPYVQELRRRLRRASLESDRRT